MMEKAKTYISQFTIKARSFTSISPSVLENFMVTLPKLQELDLLSFQNAITDKCLSQILNACTKSLTSFKLGYGTAS
jgi:hypothetical protein